MDTGLNGEIQQVVFYFLWAAFGYWLAAAHRHYTASDYWIVLALAASALAVGACFFPEQVSLDMQRNKFPPNVVFLGFNCAWVALLMLMAKTIRPSTVEALASSPLLKPFITAGYSIYLWQGAGYTAAMYGGGLLGWSDWAIWPAAVALTVALGLVAAPLERIRLRF